MRMRIKDKEDEDEDGDEDEDQEPFLKKMMPVGLMTCNCNSQWKGLMHIRKCNRSSLVGI